MNIFDILGPVMVGPSSSHTAGADRIGLMTRKLMGEEIREVTIYLHGSFAATGVGHGTDKALIAGLLGMQPDNIELPNSFEIAKERGLKFTFENKVIRGAHPNTAVLMAESVSGRKLKVRACSLGGGRILVNEVDDIEVNFSGEHPTLIVHNQDKPGLVARVSTMLSENDVNIAEMKLCRNQRGGAAVMIIETDQPVTEEIINTLQKEEGILKVTYINVED